MNRVLGLGRASRALTAGLVVVPASCIGFSLLRQQRVRCDAVAPSSSSSSFSTTGGVGLKAQGNRFEPSPQVVRQVSSGSLAGFASGLVVALFSRTLVFLGGLFIGSIHVASRFGFDVSRTLGIRERLERSSVWRKSMASPWFTASFTLTFILAAFVHL